MSVSIIENSNIVKVSTYINSIETSLSSNNILTEPRSTNVSVLSSENNININNKIIKSSDIIDLNSTINELVPVKDINAGSGIIVSSISGIYTIATTGVLTPSSIITYPQLSNSNIETLNIQKRTAKAWINFNGTGIVSIKDSFNISNIIDNGVGDYTINFTIPFSNINYTFVAWARDFNNDVYVTNALGAKLSTPKTTSSLRVIFNYLLNGLNYDSSECNLIFFSS